MQPMMSRSRCQFPEWGHPLNTRGECNCCIPLGGQRQPTQQPPVPGVQRALHPLLGPLQGCLEAAHCSEERKAQIPRCGRDGQDRVVSRERTGALFYIFLMRGKAERRREGDR